MAFLIYKNMKELLYFDKDGNSLNFQYNELSHRHEGKLYFAENSDDTFKTQAIYLFEKIPTFDYIDGTNIILDKFQLFNENGFIFNKSTILDLNITLVEASNNDPTFYSKWIYGTAIDQYFTLGSQIRFNQALLEFSNVNKVYTVIGSKKGAILILTSTDNQTFNTTYSAILSLPATYTDKTVSAVNTLQILNYIPPALTPTISDWSQPDFYTKLYDRKKMTVVNSKLNSKVITIKNNAIYDKVFYNFTCPTLTASSDLILELTLKTDLPLVYTSSLLFNSTSSALTEHRIDFGATVPVLLSNYAKFQVKNSALNNIFLTVSPIPFFNPLTQYTIDSQVIYNSKVYQCVQNYATTDTNTVLPTDTAFWGNQTFVIVNETLVNESISISETKLTTNVFTYTQEWNTNVDITLASAAEKYKDVFLSNGITLTYDSTNKLMAKLNYSSEWAEVAFYKNSVTPVNKIGSSQYETARVLEIEEQLEDEVNTDFSERFERRVVVTDLDEYGLYVDINGTDYHIPTHFIYTSGVIDLPQTVHYTLINFLLQNFVRLTELGINLYLDYTEQFTYYDTLKITAEYPNVPLTFAIRVGTTANYYIQHSELEILDIGNFMNININGKSYLETYDTSINNTIANWVTNNSDILSQYHIYVKASTNKILFTQKDITHKLSYTVSLGKSFLPAQNSYIITDYVKGNLGCLISANEVLNANALVSLENVSDFSTGQLMSINNSPYPLVNVEYNIIFLDPDRLGLSYQGPFWGTPQVGILNAFTSAFDSGFGYDPSAYNLTSSPTPAPLNYYNTVFGQNIFNSGYYDYLNNFVSTVVDYNSVEEISNNVYGTLDSAYSATSSILLTVREYIRKPRYNYQTDVQANIRWRWEDDQVPEMFYYDFSGTQLEQTGSYVYTGAKPLSKIILNDKPNRNLDYVSLSEKQQTIFPVVSYPLDYIDSETDITFEPEPVEIFIGFNSKEEGVKQQSMYIELIEDVEFKITPNISNNNIITFKHEVNTDGSLQASISLNINSTDNFFDKGLSVGQILQIFVTDTTNKKKQLLSYNNGKSFRIKFVYMRNIILEYIDTNYMTNESNVITNYPSTSLTTYMSTTFKVLPKQLAKIDLYGQTEIEDIRFKIELNNIGKNFYPQDIFIFKEYDINEKGIDWGFLNKKRKEMLLVKSDIYNYIGSYKSIINAINIFGYNDLELNEYYRNKNLASKDYGKLFKVEIPDIFDNTIEGYRETDYLIYSLPNPNYEGTNLFNLTYRITDNKGNNILLYSLDEVLIKLAGLKKWLQRNVIPITHKILDITGRADCVGEAIVQHNMNVNTRIHINSKLTPVNFDVNEAYLMPITSGSSVYNVVIDFNTQQSNNLPDYFTIKVRTYKTYKEWEVFSTYSIGDRITYYDKIYESNINFNKLNNPRKYENVLTWREDYTYIFGQLVKYNGRIYENVVNSNAPTPSPTPSAAVLSPYNNADWVEVTEWIEVNIKPVQTIDEFRKISNLLPFNFTVDKNIDPYITIDVTSDNGYGQIFTKTKYVQI